MTGGRARILSGAGLAFGLLAASYPLGLRQWCLTWGATPDEVASTLPGDELLPGADVVTTRAIPIQAPPDRIWPWLVQMGSGRAGTYSYDWVENLFGLDMHSAKVILPQFQELKVGDEFPIGSARMRIEAVEPTSHVVTRVPEWNWVRIIRLSPDAEATRLVLRNRIAYPGKGPGAMIWRRLISEQGGLVMERKILLGIKERAEGATADLWPDWWWNGPPAPP
jgi:hypothetical protein